MKVAFVGLGNMGGGMAANLVKAGHAVNAFDLSPEALTRARDNGCAVFTSVREAVDGVDAVVSMLPNGKIVASVFENDILGHAPTGTIRLDCSTSDVGTARSVTAAAVAAAFARAEPILAAMGNAVIHAGASGAGQAAKICNNMLLGASMIATCETFTMAEKLGLNLQTFYDISSKASGQNWSMTSYCPVPGVGPTTPADNDYQGGFATALMLKDLKLAMEAASLVDADVPMGLRAAELYEKFDAAGKGGLDFSAIIQTLKD